MVMEVEGPDGNVYEFPDGTPRDQMIGYFKKQQLSGGERFMKGVMDPIEGGAQLLERAVPEFVRRPVNELNNFLAQYGVVAPIGEQGLGHDVAEREKKYNQRLGLTPGFEQGGIDWARLGGSAVSPANLAAGYIGAPLATAGRLGVGAVSGMMLPDTAEGEDFWKEQGIQAGAGVAGQGIADVLGRTAARIISPKASTDKYIQTLRAEGVTPTMGQLLGKKVSRVEQGLASAPLLGSGIKEARDRAFQDFNRAVANRSLKPIGESIAKDVKPGFEMIDDVASRVNSKYNSLLPNLIGQLDNDFNNEIAQLRTMSQSMNPDQMRQFNNILNNEIINRFTGAGRASGETIKNIESKLGNLARGYMRDKDYDKRILGDALLESQAALRRMIERNNPQFTGELKQINRAWAEMLRLERAAGAAKSNEGIFTPAQYTAAVKALDPTRDKRQFARGRAMGQGLARAGQQVLGTTVPDSGTPFRTALGLGMLGGGYAIHPSILAMELAMMLPYTKTGQKVADTLIAARPAGAAALGGGLRRASAYGGLPVTEAIYQGISEE